MNTQQQFLSLVKQHQGIIYKLVNLYAIHEEDRKDLYQEILLQAWKSYDSFRGASAFSTWLYRIALNTILTAGRKRRPVMTDKIPEDAHVPDGDERQRLYAAIRTLSETDRAIISLHLEGYDNKEVSQIMGISPNNTGVKLHRIKNQLSKLLNKNL